MDHCEKVWRKVNPREKANLLSLITFFYTTSLFRKGYKNELEEDDLYEVLGSCNSKTCGDKIELEWSKQTENVKQPSVFRLIWNCFGIKYILLGCVEVTWKILAGIYEPYAMGELISYFKQGQTKITRNDAIYYAVLVTGFNGFYSLFTHNYEVILQQLGVQIRTSFSSLIYRKTLKLTPGTLSEISLGNIVTLITKDVQMFEMSIWMVNDMWTGIVQSIFMCFLVYKKMGLATLSGIGLLLAILPLQMYLGKLVLRMRLEISRNTDRRLQLTQETLSAIKIIKMFTWERYFEDKLSEARRKEVKILMRVLVIKMFIITMGAFSSRVGFYLVVMTYIGMGFDAEADKIFYVLYCFIVLRHYLAILIPYGVASGAEMYATLIRINKIIKANEYYTPTPQPDLIEVPQIHLKNVSINIKNTKLLHDVSINFEPGLTVVTGPVGCGKSSLLKTILRDYPVTRGILTTHGRISYASQDPWLFPSSIKQNILFGSKYNKARYQEVIRVCALEYDFDLLENGDETIVSDKGINLSKGQQARINLARAIYRDSEIYLLDDSLTALDAHVQDFIFNECVAKFLQGKLCILVTHNVNYMKKAEHAIYLNEGYVKFNGNPQDFPSNDLEGTLKNVVPKEDLIITDEDIYDQYNDTSRLIEPEITTLAKKKVYHEVKKVGSVNLKVYMNYLHYGGGMLIFGLIVLVFCISQFSESYSDKLISNWVNLQENITKLKVANETNTTKYEDTLLQNDRTITIYSVMIVTAAILTICKYVGLLNFSRNSSARFHSIMFTNAINAIMVFFDTHFIGNILNRFSQDLNNMDEKLPFSWLDLLSILFYIAGSTVLIGSTNWKFLIPMLVLFAAMNIIGKIYIRTSRSLKRLESATRSPMVGYMNSTFEGLTTIRAFKAEAVLKDEFDRYQDVYTSAHYTLICSERALAYFLESLCAIVTAIIIARFLFIDTDISVGDVGLIITQCIDLTSYVQWGVRLWADLENNMTSVERCLEYIEIPTENRTGHTVDNWPKTGKIQYDNVSLTYSNTNEKVLKDISFTIEPREKIGIIGRTGSGKSSLISVLFRLYDIEGKILIDSVDTKTLNLDFLRQTIAVIPQDPVLFTGTIRTNIDPLGLYKDEDIWKAIERVKIRDLVPSLDFVVSDNDLGFSSGQRQLICLARAIVRKNKIVILDEATANMDPETDTLLHSTIKDNFANCTVLTIAHRLHSVMQSDRVLVLNKGELVEFDSPYALLKDKNSMFCRMVQQSGLV